MTTDEKIIFDILFAKHNKLLLSKKECASIVNKSCSSLDRDRKTSFRDTIYQREKWKCILSTY